MDVATSFGRRDRAVLTALAIYVGRAVSADQLADAVWGETPPPRPQGLARLRGAVAQGARCGRDRDIGPGLPADRPGRRGRLPPLRADGGRSRELLALGEPERATYLLTEALELWRGPRLRGRGVVGPGHHRGRQAGRAAAGGRGAARRRLPPHRTPPGRARHGGEHGEGGADAGAALDPAGPGAVPGGRQTEALRTIHRVKSLLAEKLGLDPGPELAALEEAILRQDDPSWPRGPMPTSADCPTEVSRVRRRRRRVVLRPRRRRAGLPGLLREHGSLAVVGPSGSGKSSLVRAGVAAALVARATTSSSSPRASTRCSR